MKKRIELLAFLSFWGTSLFAQDEYRIDRHLVDLFVHYLAFLGISLLMGLIVCHVFKLLKKLLEKFPKHLNILTITLFLILFILAFVPFVVLVTFITFSINDHLSRFGDLCATIYPGVYYVLKYLIKQNNNSKSGNSQNVSGTGNIVNNGGTIQFGNNNTNG